MSNWKKYLIAGSVGFIIGAVIMGIIVGLISKRIYDKTCPKCEEEAKSKVTVMTIHGEPGTITHDKWNYKGKSICFNTKSTGKAEIKTSIDKALIPEARKWSTYVHGIQAQYSGLIYQDGIYRHGLTLLYLHRWEWFALGAGPVISFYTDKDKGRMFGGGFTVAAQVWFKGKERLR